MAITNFTGTSQLDDGVQAEILSPSYVQTAYARPVAENFLGAFGGHDFIQGSKIKSYVRLDKLAAGALTEGTDGSVTELGDSQRSLTITEHGVGVAYGDLLDVASQPGGEERVRNLMAKAYADRVDSQILALNSSFTDGVGTQAGAISLDIFLQAIHELEENEVDGPFFSVLHTTPIHTLRTLVGNLSAVPPVFTRPDVLSRIGPAMQNSYVGTLYEVDIFKSTNTPLNASEDSRVGVMLPMNAEQFPVKRLIGVSQKTGSPWDLRYEEERDASGRLTEMWMTGAWVTGLVALDYGVKITSVA